MVSERCDVVVVGARCAGAPLAALLARGGARVVLIERSVFPRDTLSSHLIEADGLAFLNRLGVIDAIRAAGAPLMTRLDLRLEEFRASIDWPQYLGDVGGFASIRRVVLDPILARAASNAGAEVLFGTSLVDVVREGDRVAGVRVRTADGETREIRAAVTIGADGRGSTLAGLVGARKYNVVQGQRCAYWSYFENATPAPELVFHQWDGRMIIGVPCDNGLYQVNAVPGREELPRFRRDPLGSVMAHAGGCEPVSEAIADARPIGPVQGATGWECYFRQASGAGWALIGDAGHFKDPCAGGGISDAFRQADALAPVVLAHLTSSPAELDRALAQWGRSRDSDFAEYYWQSVDLGAAGPPPIAAPALLTMMHASGRLGDFADILAHRRRPSAVLTPSLAMRASLTTYRTPGTNRRALLNELTEFAAQDARRLWRNRHPHYADPRQPTTPSP